MGSLNTTNVVVILDDIERTFTASTAASTSILAIYLIGMASLQPLTGRLGDRFGKRSLMISGLVGFGLSSVAAGFASSIGWLILFRGAQALFMAAVIPNAAASVRDLFPEHNRGKWMAVVLGASGVAGGLGPLLGGAVSDLFGWRYIFLLNLPAALIVAVLVRKFIEREPVTAGKTADAFGNGILTFVVLATAFALLTVASFQERPDSRIYVLAIAIGGVGITMILLSSFVRKGDPLRLVIATQRVLGVSVLTAAAGNMAMYSLVLVTAVMLAFRTGLSDGQIGLVLGSQLLGVTATQLLGGWMADRFSRRAASFGGRLVLFTGVLMFALAGPDTSVLVISLTLFIAGAGMGLSNASIRVGTLESVTRDRSGMASGL